MNYNNSKFFSKVMWIIYILIGLSGITYVVKQQNKLPVIQENTVISQTQDTFFEVFDTQDISTDDDIENNKRSYSYKVEIVEGLSSSQYDKISNEIIENTKKDISKDNVELNSIDIKFYIGKDEVHNYTLEN